MSRKQVVYYVDAKGKSPVLDDIRALVQEEQHKVFAYISLLEERGQTLRRPIADYVGDKLYELRPKAHRVLYFFLLKDYAVIVHLFRKTTDRMPASEKQLAMNRMQEFLWRYRQGKITLGGDLV